MRDEIKKISKIVSQAGGTAYLVGGCVRDMILGFEPKDFDIEVYGISQESLVSLLSEYSLDLVGKSFGILKIKGMPIDVSLPRREQQIGTGHKDFKVICDPKMTFVEASNRRDFTINTLMYNPLTEKFLDPTGRGMGDLTNKILDPVSEAFKEDSLRVLRAMQFIARFGFSPSEKLIEFSKSLTMNDLPSERVFEEFNKLILKGVFIGKGLDFLVQSTWIRFFPELQAIQNVEQDPIHHPEGKVLFHTGCVLDAFAKNRSGNDEEDLVMGYACLCHDLGKATHTQWNEKGNGKWTAYGHEEAGEAPTRSFLGKLTNQNELVESVVPLVKHHLKPRLFFKGKSSKSAIRRLALEVNIEQLCQINKFDRLGRPPLCPTEFPEIDWLINLANDCGVKNEKPKMIVAGKDLIKLGMKPGPELGVLLKKLFQMQLDGGFETVEAGILIAESLI